ncbi:ATP-binding protein, partial [Acinetobacter baumannii]
MTAASEPHVFISVVRHELAAVLSNMMNNAVEAFGSSGGTVRVEAHTEEAGRLTIRMSDSGSGVPREIADRIFE